MHPFEFLLDYDNLQSWNMNIIAIFTFMNHYEISHKNNIAKKDIKPITNQPPEQQRRGKRKFIFFALPSNSEGVKECFALFSTFTPQAGLGERRKFIFFALGCWLLKNLLHLFPFYLSSFPSFPPAGFLNNVC